MKKKLVAIGIGTIVCIFFAFFGLQLYWFYNPEIEISNGVSETRTKEMIMVSFQEKSIFGMSNSEKGRLKNLVKKTMP